MRIFQSITIFAFFGFVLSSPIWNPDSNKRLQEPPSPELYESDIMLSEEDKEYVDLRDTGDVDGPLPEQTLGKKNARRNSMWTTREIPYVISSELDATNIKLAIDTLKEAVPCVTWRPKLSSDYHFVKFVFKSGCWSYVGRTGMVEQELSIGSGCNHLGTILHEMMHAMGFWHAQSRPDRNQYVEVMWENIQPGKEHNFNKYSHNDVDVEELPYDTSSIMHYGNTYFSINGKNTLQVIGNPSAPLGQRAGLSTNDKLQLNKYYSCSSTDRTWSAWSTYTPCDSSGNKHRYRFCFSSSQCSGADSRGFDTQIVACTDEERNAPVDGHWGRWSAWGTCSKSCDKGSQTRTRQCDDPTPKNGGSSCSGESSQTKNCYNRGCHIGPDGCEFESASDQFCGWTQDSGDNYYKNYNDWICRTGSTTSNGTGPTGDHTPAMEGKGHYIYGEASAPYGDYSGTTLRLNSKSFSATSGRCMTFWYHMYGTSMGSLNIYIKGNSSPIFTTSGNKGNSWISGSANIPSQGSSYQIMIEAVRGDSWSSDIAIDDIDFKDGAC